MVDYFPRQINLDWNSASEKQSISRWLNPEKMKVMECRLPVNLNVCGPRLHFVGQCKGMEGIEFSELELIFFGYLYQRKST